MHVGLDAIPLAAPRTGVGHYTFELASHLAYIAPPGNRFELVSPFPFVEEVEREAQENLPSNLRFVYQRVNKHRRLWFTVGLPLYIKQSGFDLFHGTNYEIPLWGRCPTVLSVHDLSLLLHPETHEARLVRRGRVRLPLMARRASRIITASQSIKREISEHLKISPRKIVIIPDAQREIFRPAQMEEIVDVKRRLKIEDEFILYVGTIEPRKNLLTLLKAFEEVLRSTRLRPQLVITGKEGWLTSGLFSEVDKSAIKDRLLFTGYVRDEELRALYSSCRAFVYPSLYEGFGLPPLEAMACGAPVIASRVPSLVEPKEAGAACLVEPLDAQALARSIVNLLNDENERRSRSLAGLDHAAQFSWERTARETMDVYKQVIKEKHK